MKIRKYEARDKAACRRICSECAAGLKEGESYREAYFALNCDLYTDYGSEGCFVAVNDYDEPVGYAFCVTDMKKYNAIFKTAYGKMLMLTAPDVWLTQTLIAKKLLKIADEYPARIVVNVLPAGQRMGIGGALATKLKEYLAEQGVKGFFALCPAKNAKAAGFFAKAGFTLYKKLFGYAVFTIEI